MAAKNNVAQQETLKAPRKLRRYGATVYAKVGPEWAGAALKALEHAPELQGMDFKKLTRGKGKGMRKITLRSLELPRFWEGTEVDLYGDLERGLVAIYHPSKGD